jgi:phosphatidylglycerophosphate synthase
VLLATAPTPEGGAAAAQPWGAGTVLGRLVDQLAGLGVAAVTVITHASWADDVRLDPGVRVLVAEDAAADLRCVAELAAEGSGALLIAQADVVVEQDALAGLLGPATAVLTGDRGDDAPGVRVSHARVTAAASSFHRVAGATAEWLGVLAVAGADRGALADAAARLSELAAGEPALTDSGSLLLVGLVRAGVPVRAEEVREHFWARPLSRPALQRAAHEYAGHDAERARLDSAVKASDGFFTTFFVSPYSKHIARWAARRGLAPNAVTIVSLAIGLLAAAAFATGQRAGLIAGAVLLQVAFTLDCVDGQLARYTRTFSAFGGWLDAILDRTKEYAVYAGLAIGGAGDVWILAAGALALQTSRHMLELSWTAMQLEGLAISAHPPLEQPGAGAADGRARDARLIWVRKAIAFPIGERFAVISLTAALAGAHTTFAVVLAWGAVAGAYEIAGRLARSGPR